MLTRVFDKEKITNVVLVGVGNLGMALIAHSGFQLQQFKVVSAFDREVRKIGKYVEDVLIHDVRDLDDMDVFQKWIWDQAPLSDCLLLS